MKYRQCTICKQVRKKKQIKLLSYFSDKSFSEKQIYICKICLDRGAKPNG